jgi:hypothetical protein
MEEEWNVNESRFGRCRALEGEGEEELEIERRRLVVVCGQWGYISASMPAVLLSNCS